VRKKVLTVVERLKTEYFMVHRVDCRWLFEAANYSWEKWLSIFLGLCFNTAFQAIEIVKDVNSGEQPASENHKEVHLNESNHEITSDNRTYMQNSLGK